MSRGFPLHLLAVGVALCGLSVYLAVVASARTSDLGAEREGADSVAAESRGPELPVVSDRDERPEYRLSIETRARGRLLDGDGAVTIPCRARAGALDLGARATLVAGSGAAAYDAAQADARRGDRATLRGRHLVRLDLASEGAPVLHRVLDVRDDADLDLVLPANVELRGQVLRPDGDAIAGARVWLGEGVGPERVEVSTDAEGKFQTFLRFGGPGVPLVVRAAGRASTYRVVDVGPEGAEFRVQLEEARRLDLRLAAAVDAPARGEIRVVPSGAAGQVTALRQYPFFMHAFEPLSLDARGRVAIADLPTEGVVRIHVEHPEAAASRAVRVRLGQRREGPVLIAAGPPARRCRGRVVDAATGAPIAGARVAFDPGGAGSMTHSNDGWLLPAAYYRRELRSTRSGGDGRFDLSCSDAVKRAPGLLLARAAGYLGVAVSLDEAASAEGGEVTLALPSRTVAAASEGPPTLRFDLPTQGRRYLVQANGGNWLSWEDSEPFELALADPSIVDVTVVLDAAPGQPRVERSFLGTAVVGAVPLALGF